MVHSIFEWPMCVLLSLNIGFASHFFARADTGFRPRYGLLILSDQATNIRACLLKFAIFFYTRIPRKLFEISAQIRSVQDNNLWRYSIWNGLSNDFKISSRSNLIEELAPSARNPVWHILVILLKHFNYYLKLFWFGLIDQETKFW
jgi:hypothetical protein